MMMMMAILIWHGLGVQGQHVYRALKRTWELFTVSEMAMGCVYLCFPHRVRIVYGSGKTDGTCLRRCSTPGGTGY